METAKPEISLNHHRGITTLGFSTSKPNNLSLENEKEISPKSGGVFDNECIQHEGKTTLLMDDSAQKHPIPQNRKSSVHSLIDTAPRKLGITKQMSVDSIAMTSHIMMSDDAVQQSQRLLRRRRSATSLYIKSAMDQKFRMEAKPILIGPDTPERLNPKQRWRILQPVTVKSGDHTKQQNLELDSNSMNNFDSYKKSMLKKTHRQRSLNKKTDTFQKSRSPLIKQNVSFNRNEDEENEGSNKHPSLPLLRFRSAVRTMMVILRASRNSSSEGKRSEEKILSLVHYQDEILNSRRCNYGDGLSFDPMQYRAVKEVTVSNEAKAILSMDSSVRTEEQLHVALLSLQTTVDSFCEFPIKMQQSLVERGWYEHFENKRVIIRQGHTAANFYMILSGEAVVTVVESASDTKQTTVAVLDKGNTFGELAIMHGARRSATVTCKGDVELLAVAREDFVDIFMHVDKEREPEHIAYLRTIDVLQKWPIERLPWDDPKICLFTYFRRGTVMCRDLEKSEWIYVIKTGSCRVLTTLRSTKPQIPRKHNTASKILSDTGSFTSSSESIYSIFSNSTVKSSKSEPKPRDRIKKVRFMDPNSNSTSIDSLSTESRLGHGLSRGMHTSLHKLPTLRKNKTFTDEELMTRHQLQLDTIAQEVTALRLKQGQRLHNLTSNDPKQDDLFVQLQTLGPTETFGLEPLAFHSDKCGKRVSLVSDGAEAILISRKFFCLHAPDQYYRKLRATIRQYPTCESLQQKLQIQANWDAFKKQSFCVHKSSSNRPQHVAQISSKVK